MGHCVLMCLHVLLSIYPSHAVWWPNGNMNLESDFRRAFRKLMVDMPIMLSVIQSSGGCYL